MRTVLRASISTAVLAGALLAPIAGTAYAATAPQAAPAAPTAGHGYGADTQIDVAPGFTAVVRHTAGGPEVEILAVGSEDPNTFPTRSLGVLTPGGPAISANGLELKLVKSGKGHVLTATKDGSTKSWTLPEDEPSTDCQVGPIGQDIGAGMYAELFISEQGPKVLLFEAADRGRNFDELNRSHPSVSAGFIARIVNPSGAKPVFEWKTQGGNDVLGQVAFPALPKGCKPSYPTTNDRPTSCVSKVKQVDLGAGLQADLTMSSMGPKAVMHGSDPAGTWNQTLTRFNPKGSPDYFSRINNPSGAKPVFEWKTQGGDNVPSGFENFPALPKGCTLDYKVTEETPAPKPEPSTAKPVTATNVSAQTVGQTTVVPQGSVAAGAEIASEDTDNSTTVAAGAGLLAVSAALGATVLRRRRSHS
ncbi:hypothetical protein [Streptomyces sp. NBC_01439]|uniref:hypothetical protein n=1 Tax=Streptomyces sp. NBC_01439 TaxID=2903867 RepID=UPI002E2C8264|nr:hypothetical protein [Streptomyces sp. NBC_01439]